MPNNTDAPLVSGEILRQLDSWCNNNVETRTRQRGLMLLDELKQALAREGLDNEAFAAEYIEQLEAGLNSFVMQHDADVAAMEASNAAWTVDFNAQREQFEGYIDALDREIQARDEKIEEQEALLEPPHEYGSFVRQTPLDPDEQILEGEAPRQRVDVSWRGRVVSVYVADDVSASDLKFGQRLLIAPDGGVLRALDEFEERGTEATVDEMLADGRIRIELPGSDKMIAFLADPDSSSVANLKSGDSVLYDRASGFVIEKLPEKESSALFLEDIPNIMFEDIGGQHDALIELREHIEMPLLHRELCEQYGYQITAGILLYGPPGVGKTLSLKAVANEIRHAEGREVYLLKISGPELTSKWVGETERQIREPFQVAEAIARREPNSLVIVLFDEIEAMFPTRGSRSGDSGVSASSVTQFCTMLDGITEHRNIMVIGTTNRPDMIDPALTRPGRLHPAIEYPRPDRAGVESIFGIYLGDSSLPLHAKYTTVGDKDFQSKDRDVVSRYLIGRCIERIYLPEGKDPQDLDEKILDDRAMLSVRFRDTGEEEQFFMEDFITGALVEAIVSRAKMFAMRHDIKAHAETCSDTSHEGHKITSLGMRFKHLVEAIEETFEDGKALPSRTDPREWARILDLGDDRPFEIISSQSDMRAQRPVRTRNAT